MSAARLHTSASGYARPADSTRAGFATEPTVARLEALIAGASEAILLTDAGHVILQANAAAERMFGVVEGGLAGLAVDCFVPAWVLPNADALTSSQPDGAAPRPRSIEARVTAHRIDGTEFPVELRAVTLAVPGAPAAVAIYLRDISAATALELHSRDLEDQLLRAQKIEGLGRLAGGIAHDFNNFLQVIRGYASLALEDDAAAGALRRQVEHVIAASERAEALTRRLLSFGRQEPPQKADVELNRHVERAVQLLARLIGEHIEVEFLPDPAVGVVHADPTQLDQVLLNLCLNARDAMPAGGRLTVATAAEARRATRHGQFVSVSVRDTGVGMPAEVLARAREPFFSTKPSSRGTGLGLSVVETILRQHGGYLEIESTPGHGTVVRCGLPHRAPSAPVVDRPLTPAPTPRLVSGASLILVADDEPGVRDLTRDVLEGFGYRVVTAADGTEACALFDRHREEIAAVILDLVMPRFGGAEALGRMRAVRPDLPAVLCSGYGDDWPGAPTDDAVATLNKPYLPRDLLTTLALLIG
ncbi:MAG: ATP-binding protein [Acidobacteriota bacterium]